MKPLSREREIDKSNPSILYRKSSASSSEVNKLLERITMENLENYFLNFIKNHTFISSKTLAKDFVREMMEIKGTKSLGVGVICDLTKIVSCKIKKMIKELKKENENIFVKFNTNVYRINPNVSLIEL